MKILLPMMCPVIKFLIILINQRACSRDLDIVDQEDSENFKSLAQVKQVFSTWVLLHFRIIAQKRFYIFISNFLRVSS